MPLYLYRWLNSTDLTGIKPADRNKLIHFVLLYNSDSYVQTVITWATCRNHKMSSFVNISHEAFLFFKIIVSKINLHLFTVYKSY